MATMEDTGISIVAESQQGDKDPPPTSKSDSVSDDVLRVEETITESEEAGEVPQPTDSDVQQKDSGSNDTLREEEPTPDINLDEIDKLDPSQLPPEIKKEELEKLAKHYRNAKSIRVLLTGKTGSGKSTLVNGILGLKVKDERAKEGKSIKGACTTEVSEYKTKKGGIDVTVWDSPGLQDGTKKRNQDYYLRQMKDKCTPRDLTLYCIKAGGETRFVRGTDNPDTVAMKKLTEKFGVDFWKNVVVILTFANIFEAFHVEWKSLKPEEKATKFQSVINEWKEQIQEILEHDAGIPKDTIDKIKVVPAGHYLEPHLPDREYWLSALWLNCVTAIPTPEGQAALIKMNFTRMKRKRDVKETDFDKKPEEQPIIVPDDIHIDRAFVAGSAAMGCLVGSLIVLGGPLAVFAIVTIPLGTMLGARFAEKILKS